MKAIFTGLISLAILIGAIQDWTSYGLLDKVVVIILIIGSTGLTYKFYKEG